MALALDLSLIVKAIRTVIIMIIKFVKIHPYHSNNTDIIATPYNTIEQSVFKNNNNHIVSDFSNLSKRDRDWIKNS